jgi:O-antigen/teichoic acid export membrane protein/phosphorylcholine metabolism protein LicD
MEAKKSLTKNSLYYLFYNILNIAFPFITGIYVARVLLPDPIGVVAYAQNITNYFVIFAFLGIPTYGLREVAKVRNDKEGLNRLYSELFLINLFSTVFFCIAYLITVFSVPAFQENLPLYLITGIGIAINALNIDWLYEGLEEYKLISVRNVIFKVLSFLLLVIFVRKPEDYLIFAAISVIGTSGNYIFNVIYSRKTVHFTRKGLNLKRHLKSVFTLTAVNLAIEISTMVDTTMLGAMCDKETVAFYSYGSKIKGILLQIVNSFTVVIVPRISTYYKEKKWKEYNDILTKALEVIMVISVPMIIGIWFTGDFLVSKIYGEAFIRSSMVLKILSFNLLISPIGYLLGSRVMLVSGHEGRMPWCVGAGALLNLGLNFWMIPIYKEVGASFTSVLSELFTAIIYIVASHRYFHLNSFAHSTVSTLLAGGVIAGYLYGCSKIPMAGWLVTLVQIIGAVVLYFLVLLLTKEGISSSYLKGFLRKMKKNREEEHKELTLEEIQMGSFQVLCKIKEICEENSIRYSLAFGTLLGAIRHNGFIPWDDDIDVVMPRPDYEKFLSYCKAHPEVLGRFALKHYSNCKKYIYPIARLVDTDYVIRYNSAKEYGLGLFVDIYPLDGFEPSDKKWLHKLSRNIQWIARCGQRKFVSSAKWYRNIFKVPTFLLSRFMNMNKLIRKTDSLAQKYPYDQATYVSCMAWDWEPGVLFEKKWLDVLEPHVFVNQNFMVPKEYDSILKASYGNYMELPPKEERVGHHNYSAYKKVK